MENDSQAFISATNCKDTLAIFETEKAGNEVGLLSVGRNLILDVSSWKSPFVSQVELLSRKPTGNRGWGEIQAAERHPRVTWKDVFYDIFS